VVDQEGGDAETIEQNLTGGPGLGADLDLTGGPGLGADLDLTETLRLRDAHLAGTDAFAGWPASTHEATQPAPTPRSRSRCRSGPRRSAR